MSSHMHYGYTTLLTHKALSVEPLGSPFRPFPFQFNLAPEEEVEVSWSDRLGAYVPATEVNANIPIATIFKTDFVLEQSYGNNFFY